MLKKILIIDDSSVFHNLYRVVLHRYNCEIFDAMNGQEALELLSREKDIQLILTDINMPVMNGVQFLEKASALGISRKIPIIVLSSEDKDSNMLRGMRLGARGYLKKPFTAKDFHVLVEKIFALPRRLSTSTYDCNGERQASAS